LDRAFTLEFWDVDLAGFLGRRTVDPDTARVLLDLHGILAKVRRHFGYRTAGEVLSFIGHGDATPELLDHAVFAKVLPRLRGEETPAFVEALRETQQRCEEAALARCARKLAEMQHRLKQTGVVRFWA
jgi:5-methylcytosine-specific restriction protein B